MAEQNSDTSPKEEPSVLDWVKAIFSRRPVPLIPELPPDSKQVAIKPSPKREAMGGDSAERLTWSFPWRILSALSLALFAQFFLQPPIKNQIIGIILYSAAVGMAVWSTIRGDLSLASQKERILEIDALKIQLVPLLLGLFLSVVAVFLFSKNQFTTINVFIWVSGLICVIWSIWQPTLVAAAWFDKIRTFLQKEVWQPRISRWNILFVVALGVCIYFRVHQLGDVAPEMTSDHLEKLWDVNDILQGTTPIYFPRNTGREGLQMYLIAATIKLFGTGISFLSMKIGTVALGLFMLPYMYLLGKEIGNRWTGMLAMLLTGIGFWPNVLARVALRFILYPAFVAPLLYHIFRGIRTSNRNHFIAAGIFLGIGLHGYTPFRVVPILVIVMVGLYLIHERSNQARKQVFIWLGLLILVTIIIFLPLLRYGLENPVVFNYRLTSRLFGVDQKLPEDIWPTFRDNVWNGLMMTIWSSGNTWVTTLPHQPSLDVVTGAMFVLGFGLLVARYVRKRHWEDIFLLLAVPILMLPSTLALANPIENPSPNRAGGAMVVVFLMAALALEALLRGIKDIMGENPGKKAVWIIGIILIWIAGLQNYGMTFNRFKSQYIANVWNTSELGAIIENFILTVGDPNSAWVVAFPHWVDTRLVGVNAGYPTKDYAIWPDEIDTTLEVPGPKLFLFKPEDIEALVALREHYPQGAAALHLSDVLYKDFYIYFVPATESEEN
jgi:hypothetical protein